MASLMCCSPPTAGRGAMWPGWTPSRSTASSSPPAAGSGRETGTWIRAAGGNPARPGWEQLWTLLLFVLLFWLNIKTFSCTFFFYLQGWEYAVDFPANFSPEKKWNSCVRRRRWIRYRRYTAQGTWAKVCQSPHFFFLFFLPLLSFPQILVKTPFLQIPLENPRKPPLPLCDISCGGWEMSDQSGRYPYLWGVTQQGQVSLLDWLWVLLWCILCFNKPNS